MNKNFPLVSAIVTTHNRSSLLKRALKSVVEQSYPNIELIVVDDGSEDDTKDTVKFFENRINLKYVHNKKALGACAARNIGIKKAQGIFVAGLDDDDIWHIDRLKTLYQEYSDDFAFITSDVIIQTEKNKHTWRKKSLLNLDDLLYSNQVGNQVLVKRERIIDVGGYDESLTSAQDYDLWIRLCHCYGPVKNVQKALQTVFEESNRNRITTNKAAKISGYISFYSKHKSKMSVDHRKYQLFLIRRKINKPISVKEFINFVPIEKYWKELKRLLFTKRI